MNERGASCLGPHSGLKMQEEQFRAALATLGDGSVTTVVLVTRPEASAVAEAERTSVELRALGLANQHLVVNGVFRAIDELIRLLSRSRLRCKVRWTICRLCSRPLPRDSIPLRAFDTVGVAALRALATSEGIPAMPPVSRVDDTSTDEATSFATLPRLNMLADRLANADSGLIMVYLVCCLLIH